MKGVLRREDRIKAGEDRIHGWPQVRIKRIDELPVGVGRGREAAKLWDRLQNDLWKERGGSLSFSSADGPSGNERCTNRGMEGEVHLRIDNDTPVSTPLYKF